MLLEIVLALLLSITPLGTLGATPSGTLELTPLGTLGLTKPVSLEECRDPRWSSSDQARISRNAEMRGDNSGGNGE